DPLLLLYVGILRVNPQLVGLEDGTGEGANNNYDGVKNMAMRDLVNGGAACAVPGSSSSSSTSNPLGALTNALLGSSSKTQERLREIPNATRAGPGPQFYSQDQHLSSLPGSELDQPLLQPGAQVNAV
ncbi:hypothetical protein HID58_087978, partial [Brassica napus]